MDAIVALLDEIDQINPSLATPKRVDRGPIVEAEEQEEPRDEPNEREYLPEPFFADSFQMSDWTRRNLGHILEKHPRWRDRLSLEELMHVENTVPRMIAFVHQCSPPLITGDSGVVLMDGSGRTVSATIQSLSRHERKLRVHYGMALVLRDVALLTIGTRFEREKTKHLIITADSIEAIYSNVHYLD